MSIDPADIPVLIPAGGLGMRLREETERIPKPMVEIGGRPILWHIMKVFAGHGHRNFVIMLGYKGWVIKDWLMTYQLRLADIRIDLTSAGKPEVLASHDAEDWSVTLIETGLHTGTIGRLQQVERYVDAPYFMYAYGDSIGDVDVTAVRRRHEAADNAITVTGVRPRNRYGVILADDDGQVTNFAEKPEVTVGHANGGFAAVDTAILERIRGDDPGGFFEDLLGPLAEEGRLGLHEHEGFWVGMDTMRDVVGLEELWEAGRAPWKSWED